MLVKWNKLTSFAILHEQPLFLDEKKENNNADVEERDTNVQIR